MDLLGAFYFTKQAFSNMKPGGAIVNVSSVHAVETTPLVASYAAAKAALLRSPDRPRSKAKQLGIRVNAVLPGAVDTPMLWENPNVKSGVETINRNDVGKPEDIAADDRLSCLGRRRIRTGSGGSRRRRAARQAVMQRRRLRDT